MIRSIRTAREVKMSRRFVLLSTIFFLSLQYSYISFIVPTFKYAGFSVEPDAIKYIESCSFYIVFLLMAPKRFSRPSDFLMVYLFLMIVIPLLILYGLADKNRLHLYIVLSSVILIELLRTGRPIRFPVLLGGKQLSFLIPLAGAAFVTGWSIAAGGLGGLNFDLGKVYDFRELQAEKLNVGLISYVNVWATKVFGPLLMAFFLWRKKYVIAIAVFLLHIFWFAIMAHKSIIFYPLLIVFVWVWYRRNYGFSIIPAGFLLILGISSVINVYYDSPFIASLLIRRVFFVPASLTFSYFEFFSENNLVLWSNSFASAIVDYPYHLSPAKLIGEYAVGKNVNANNSFLATGYMHAGISGVVIYSVVVGFLFRAVDSLVFQKLPTWLGLATILIPAHALLTSADLPTALLTHGLGLAILILFMQRDVRSSNPISDAQRLDNSK